MRTICAAILVCVAVTGCGLNVQSPDLFLLTRTGPGSTLSLLVNDSGTVRCNGGKAKKLSDPLLLRARDLATSLDNDAKSKLRIAPSANSVFFYRIKLQDGTVSFPDTAGAGHAELAQAEQFALNAVQACGLGG
jgi:hypothetical protein